MNGVNYAIHRMEVDRKASKLIFGAGVVIGGISGIVGVSNDNPYSGNANVQKYMGLEGRAKSLRGDIKSAKRNPMVKSAADPEAVTKMGQELTGIDAQMVQLGTIPDVMRYQGWSESPNNSISSLVGLALVLIGAYRLMSSYESSGNPVAKPSIE